MTGWEAIDLAWMQALQSVHAPWLDAFFVWLTDPPHREIYFVAAGLALVVLGRRKGWIAALTLALAITLTDRAIDEWLKPAVGRVRPCFEHPDLVRFLLEKQSRSPSFPSAHAANAFAVAVVLWELRRSVGLAALGLAVLIAYSRPYVGVHYPLDVLGGAVFGAAVALGSIGLRRGALRGVRWIRGRAPSRARPGAGAGGTASPPDTPVPPRGGRSPRRADP